MPTESRILSFNNNEVFEAIKGYCSQTGRSLPDNGLIEFHNSEVMLKSAEGESVRFSENEVGAALIMFCIRSGIPIARRAVKSLRISRDVVSLLLEIRP